MGAPRWLPAPPPARNRPGIAGAVLDHRHPPSRSSLLDGPGHNRYGLAMARRLAEVDSEVAKALHEEAQRQHRNLELIASENFVSEAVLEATGSVLTNKYAEGYPGRRYYGGCEVVDIVEDLAIARAKELFGCEHTNVQPHSGAQANMAVYFTLLKPGDVVLGPNLSHGGPPRDRLHALRWDRARGRRHAHGRHRSSGRAGRRRAASLADRDRGLRHDHHAQDAARAAGRHGDVPGRPRRGARQDGHAGRA